MGSGEGQTFQKYHRGLIPFLNIPTCLQVQITGVTTLCRKKRGGHGYLPKVYNRLFKANQSAHSRPEVTVVSKRAFDGEPYLNPWSENAGS